MDTTPTRRRQVLAAAGLGTASLLAGCGSVLGGSGGDGQSYSVPDDVTVDWTHTGEEIYDPEFRELAVSERLQDESSDVLSVRDHQLRIRTEQFDSESWEYPWPYTWDSGGPYAFDFVETAEQAADELREDGVVDEFVDDTDFEESYVLTLTITLQPEMGLELADVYYHVQGVSVIAWITGPMMSPSTPDIDHLLLRVTDEDGPPGSSPPSVDAQFLWPPGADDYKSE